MFRKPIFLYLISIFSAIIFVLLIFWALDFRILTFQPQTAPVVIVVEPSPTPTPDPDRPFSILLLGYAGANHDGGGLTDSIILSRIRPHDQQIDLISIPRDLWVEASPDKFTKINSILPLHGPEALKSVVASISGETIEHHVAIDFNGFIKVVDILGGVDLKITRPFVDLFYPLDVGATDTCGKSPEEVTALSATMSGEKLDHQFTCRYEQLVMNVGTTHLDGATALKYARSRHSEFDGGDFNRSNRQRQVLLAVRDKALNINIFPRIIPIFNTLKSHLRSDLSVSDLEKYLFRALEFSKYDINSISINDKNFLMQSYSSSRQSILIPRAGLNEYSDIRQFIATYSASLER
jgi:LCP family protein required for cell wall assembly